jgi:hypothetical protein
MNDQIIIDQFFAWEIIKEIERRRRRNNGSLLLIASFISKI